MNDMNTPDISLPGTGVPGAGAAAPVYTTATEVVGTPPTVAAPMAVGPDPVAPAGAGVQQGEGSYEMQVNTERIEQFRSEIDQMRVKGANGSAERWLLVVGVVLVLAGVALGVLGAVQVVNSGDSPPDQRAAMASGSLLGIVMVIAGAAVFLRYSLARYLRFWLVRLVYEGHSDADRIVAAIDRASGYDPPADQPPPY